MPFSTHAARICILAVFCSVYCLQETLVSASVKPSTPNFLFIIADDCTHRDLGCYGGQAFTPHLDQLAREGMRFTHCFQAAPMCSPTRHNIYTGLYPVKSGAYPNHAFAKPGTKSVVQYLKPAGYRVALSGKKHIAPASVFPFEMSGKNNPDWDAVEKLFAECAETSTPFCLFACSNEPHSPWDKGDATRYPPDQIKLPSYFVDTPETREDMARYLAEITYFDGQVGKCLGLLDEHGLADNTMVVVVSEQGSGFPFGKWTCYDTGLQSACIVRWPSHLDPGSVSDAMIEYVDFLPTFLEAANIPIPPVLDGRSFVSVLRGETDHHKDHVFGLMTTRGIINGSEQFGIRSIRSGQYKYILNLTPEIPFRNVCMKARVFQSWIKAADNGNEDAADKINRYRQRPAVELYDVTRDPLEWNNLAGDPKLADIQADLSKRLQDWMKSQGDQGIQTELEAFQHQTRALRSNRNRKKPPR